MRNGDVYHHAWSASRQVTRATVDLTGYPDMVVMYLAMRARSPRGLVTMARFGLRLHRAMRERPEGLLHWESISFGPFERGMRQYWRDLDALEAWARAPPHRDWWTDYLRDPKGTGFWHETYFMRGGMEAIYDAVGTPPGLGAFAPRESADGGLFAARRRAERAREASMRGVPALAPENQPQEGSAAPKPGSASPAHDAPP